MTSSSSSSSSGTDQEEQVNCQSCFGLTYFHRSYLDEKRSGRCIGLRRSIPISSETAKFLKSESTSNVSNELDEMWCLGISRWSTSTSSTLIPRCGPGLRLLFLPSTTNRSTTAYPISTSTSLEKQVRMVSRHEPAADQIMKKSRVNSILVSIQRHLDKQVNVMRNMTEKWIWMTTDSAYLRLFINQLRQLPNRMEKSTETYLKYVAECLSNQ